MRLFPHTSGRYLANSVHNKSMKQHPLTLPMKKTRGVDEGQASSVKKTIDIRFLDRWTAISAHHTRHARRTILKRYPSTEHCLCLLATRHRRASFLHIDRLVLDRRCTCLQHGRCLCLCLCTSLCALSLVLSVSLCPFRSFVCFQFVCGSSCVSQYICVSVCLCVSVTSESCVSPDLCLCETLCVCLCVSL
mgnify:CR=1 FL=1